MFWFLVSGFWFLILSFRFVVTRSALESEPETSNQKPTTIHAFRTTCTRDTGLNTMADVGQEIMHSPHWTQDDSPIGSFKSKLMPADGPLPVRPMTLLFFTSSQAREQRSHSTQAE